MEPEASLPYKQEPVTRPYPKPDKSIPNPHTLILYDQF
jgi:hypothetical protein